MGRRLRDESPLMTLKNGWLARSPETSRIVVPLLPELSTSAGSARAVSSTTDDPEALRRSGHGAVVVLFDLDAESSQAPQHGRAVIADAEVRDVRLAVGYGVEQRGPVGDGLVAGRHNRTFEA